MSIFDLLKTSRSQQLQMMQQVLDCPNPEEREKLFRRFVVEISYQQSAEARFLLTPLERAGFQVFSSAKAEEAQMAFDQRVDAILHLPNDHADWLPKVSELFVELEQNLKDSSRCCPPELERELSDDSKAKLAKDYMVYMDSKPDIMLQA